MRPTRPLALLVFLPLLACTENRVIEYVEPTPTGPAGTTDTKTAPPPADVPKPTDKGALSDLKDIEAPPAITSCKGYCGTFLDKNPCTCDDGCDKAGDCCGDYVAVCGAPAPDVKTTGYTFPDPFRAAELSVNDCKGIASGDKSYCDTNDCKGIATEDKSYCATADCKGIAVKDKSYCKSGDCKGIATGDKTYCETNDCKGIALKDTSYCDSKACRAIIRESSSDCN